LVVLNTAELHAQPEPALARAVFLARETNAALVLFASNTHPLHTVMPGKAAPHAGGAPHALLPEGQGRVQAIAEGIIKAERLTVTAEVVWSPHPFDAIMRMADALRPDMVIKTTRHDNRLSRTLFNYTDWHLIRALTCPLMLVKGEDLWETRRIVACVDPAHVHSQAEMLDDGIVEAAQVLAYRLRGELHIFPSVELLLEPAFRLLHPELSYAEHVEAAMSEHTTLVEDLLRRFGIGSHKVHLALGKPSETLPAFAREVEASLVVMGVVSKGTLERLLIGNTAEKVLDDLRCDILVIKAQPLEARVEASDVVVC
jgi:universal stress protein E